MLFVSIQITYCLSNFSVLLSDLLQSYNFHYFIYNLILIFSFISKLIFIIHMNKYIAVAKLIENDYQTNVGTFLNTT